MNINRSVTSQQSANLLSAKFFRAWDADKDNKISAAEYTKAFNALPEEERATRNLNAEYYNFDKNQDGAIEQSELIAGFAQNYSSGQARPLDSSTKQTTANLLSTSFFKVWDADKDNKISAAEYTNAFNALSSEERATRNLNAEYYNFDKNQDGAIDQTELVTGFVANLADKPSAKRGEAPKSVQAVALSSKFFQAWDADKDNKINAEEYTKAFNALPEEERASRNLNAEYYNFDKNQDGAIDASELTSGFEANIPE